MKHLHIWGQMNQIELQEQKYTFQNDALIEISNAENELEKAKEIVKDFVLFLLSFSTQVTWKFPGPRIELEPQQ